MTSLDGLEALHEHEVQRLEAVTTVTFMCRNILVLRSESEVAAAALAQFGALA